MVLGSINQYLAHYPRPAPLGADRIAAASGSPLVTSFFSATLFQNDLRRVYSYEANGMKLTVAFLSVIAIAAAQDTAIDIQRSTITIHVGKAGLLSVAGHDHTISAPISSGAIRDSPTPHVGFTVATAKITVMPDPKVDAKTQAQIQKDMEEMTLETGKYPQITFRSTRVDNQAEGQWKVDGDLALHGVTKPVSLTVKRTGDSYVAHTALKQSSFGIKPISVGGGTIKVKDEVEIDFTIYPRR
jgi:polyisoprenoid-binding protein YceI